MEKILFALLYRPGAARFAAWRNRYRVVFACYRVTEQPWHSSDDPKELHVNQQRVRASAR